MNTVSVLDMTKDWLTTHRYDGLYNEEYECGCGLKDFAPCDYGPYYGCVAAKALDSYIHPGEPVYLPVEVKDEYPAP